MVQTQKKLKGSHLAHPPKDELYRLGQKRVIRAIKAIELCGALGSYHPTADQARAIDEALTQALDRARIRLRGEPMFTVPVIH